jgi:hypothetical protein
MNIPLCDIEKAGPETAVLTGNERPEIRVEKVLAIRRQLGEGRYSIAERLDVVIDRIIKDLA